MNLKNIYQCKTYITYAKLQNISLTANVVLIKEIIFNNKII